MAVFAYLLAFLAAGMSALFFLRVRSPTSIVLSILKVLTGSVAAFVAVMGTLGVAFGVLSRAYLAIPAGVMGALLSVRYVLRVAARHDGFERAFGLDWRRQIAPEQQARMLKRRWVWQLPSHRGVRWDRDVSFWTIPGTDRELLCDIWQPPEDVSPSGLAFIYFHGSAWHWLDKDFNTRPFFRHLATQGHVVMDVAYRLCPEVDIYGMIGDVKRAVVWMKTNAEKYGLDPARVVVAGGSAGGHLALLAAYAPDHPELTPGDVREADRSVRAVVAYYGPADMRAFYQHFGATFGSLGKGLEPGEGSILLRITGAVTEWVIRSSSEKMKEQQPFSSFDWMVANLLGGSPDTRCPRFTSWLRRSRTWDRALHPRCSCKESTIPLYRRTSPVLCIASWLRLACRRFTSSFHRPSMASTCFCRGTRQRRRPHFTMWIVSWL